jgi:hypothetical protein
LFFFNYIIHEFGRKVKFSQTRLKNLIRRMKKLVRGDLFPGPRGFVILHKFFPKTQPPFVHIDEDDRRFSVVKR